MSFKTRASTCATYLQIVLPSSSHTYEHSLNYLTIQQVQLQIEDSMEASVVTPCLPLDFPPELKEKILDTLTNFYVNEPALLWTYCRHLSAHQKRALEQHFHDFWLPKLVVTLYRGCHSSADYCYVNDDKDTQSGNVQPATDPSLANFRITEPTDRHVYNQDGSRMNIIELVKPQESWLQYSFNTRVAHIRLGENYLKRGFEGGHIVNDTGLPGLQGNTDWSEIWFDWVGVFDELFREEIMRNRIRESLVSLHLCE